MPDTYADVYSNATRLTAGVGPAVVGATPGTQGNTVTSTNITVTLTVGVQVGHHLVLAVGHSSQINATSFTVADSKGQTWGVDADLDLWTPAVYRGVTHWSAAVTTAMVAGDTVTATLAPGLAGEKLAAALIELDQTVAVDGSGTGQTASTQTALSASATATVAGTLLVSAAVSSGTVTATKDASLTLGPTDVTAISAPDYRINTAYKALPAAGAATAAWTLSAGQAAACTAVVYKPHAVAAPENRYQSVNGVWVPIVGLYQSNAGSWV